MPDQHSSCGKASFMPTSENGPLSGVRNSRRFTCPGATWEYGSTQHQRGSRIHGLPGDLMMGQQIVCATDPI